MLITYYRPTSFHFQGLAAGATQAPENENRTAIIFR